MYYDEYYDIEPSEFDEKCGELIEFLKSKVKKEIQDELDRLRKENAELSPLKLTLGNKLAELEREKDRYKWQENAMREQITRELKRTRLSELLSEFATILYVVRNEPIVQEKCNRCDNDRRIQYTTPLGRIAYERCTCADTINHYVVKEADCSEFKIYTRNDEAYTGKLVGWYKLKKERDYDYYESATFAMDNIYKGEDFKDLKYYYNVYFYEKEKAQEYVDWLNDKEKGTIIKSGPISPFKK